MVKAKPFEVQTQHGTLSTTMLIQVNKEMVSKMNSWKLFSI